MIKELFSNNKKIICIVGMGFVGTAMAAAVIGQTGPRYLGNAQKLIKEKLGIIL